MDGLPDDKGGWMPTSPIRGAEYTGRNESLIAPLSSQPDTRRDNHLAVRTNSWNHVFTSRAIAPQRASNRPAGDPLSSNTGLFAMAATEVLRAGDNTLFQARRTTEKPGTTAA